MFKSQFAKIIAVSCLISLSGCAMTSVRQHQDFNDIAKNIGKVAILPPDVDIKLVSLNGDDQDLLEREQQIEDAILGIAKQRLKEEHLEVIDFDFEAAMAADEAFAFSVTQCLTAWETAKGELYEKGLVADSAKSDFRTNLGSVANEIAVQTGAEAVLLMHFSGVEKSGGMIAKDVATSALIGVLTAGVYIPIQPTSAAFIDLALVDAHGGHVLWANRKSLPGIHEDLAKTALAELPDVLWQSELAESQSSGGSEEIAELTAVATETAAPDAADTADRNASW